VRSSGASTTQIVFGALLLVVVTVDAPELRTWLAGLGPRRRGHPHTTTRGTTT
jgi:hypothetical protein